MVPLSTGSTHTPLPGFITGVYWAGLGICSFPFAKVFRFFLCQKSEYRMLLSYNVLYVYFCVFEKGEGGGGEKRGLREWEGRAGAGGGRGRQIGQGGG
jgi:hypothetical protein